MAETVWCIDGYDGAKKIFDQRIPRTHITVAELEALLRALAAKYGQLTDEELVANFLRRNIKGYRPDLEVRRPASRPPTIMCGDNPHFIATAREA
jgi:hypothetical protein